jgi:hypothetical protein
MVQVFRILFGDLGFFTVVILRWVWWFIYGIIMIFLACGCPCVFSFYVDDCGVLNVIFV